MTTSEAAGTAGATQAAAAAGASQARAAARAVGHAADARSATPAPTATGMIEGRNPPPFDITGPLPRGTTVLEASAGTGKTYALAALAARFVAEGAARLDQQMLVTFSRTATNELRLRVRERLATLERRLASAVTEDPAADGGLDPVEALLCRGEVTVLRERHARVAAALADFDQATIATTHEFCQRMLDGLGVLGDQEPGAVFVDELTELTREVTSDCFLRRYAPAGRPPLTFATALTLAGLAVSSPHAALAPDLVEAERAGAGRAADLVSFAAEIREEVEGRKRGRRLVTYDDLLTRLRDVLADPEHGEAAGARLRDRYRVVMVDEFQDTDPIQWEILRRAFAGRPATTLIVIGDPKQAIYAFRGADVYSYLEAVGGADRVATLATNWRADAALVDALDALLGGAALGDPRIVVRPVAARRQERRLLAAPGDGNRTAPIRIRVRPGNPESRTPPPVADQRAVVCADLVRDVVDLLDSGVRVATARAGSTAPRPVGPRDVAVLVRRNDRGEVIRDALIAAEVPAVLRGAASVFSTAAAADWLTLLRALEQPRSAALRRAAVTDLVGWTFHRLARAGDAELTELTQQLRWWSRVLAKRGVAALLESITADTGLPERLLGEVGGDRRLTDIRHLAQSLHSAMTRGHLGPRALVGWLERRVSDALRDTQVDTTRRLETDADAVTVITVHRSKGLEFPIVYLPEAWDRHVATRDSGEVLRLHATGRDPGRGGRSTRCVLDVGGLEAPGRAERWSQHNAEESGEDLRLLYVALTRAQCQVVTWWAPSRTTGPSGLHRILNRPPPAAGTEVPPNQPVGLEPVDPARGASLMAAGVVLEKLEAAQVTTAAGRAAQGAGSGPAYSSRPGPSAALRVRTFWRSLDLDWRRTSYSALTAGAHDAEQTAGVGSEPETVREDDESPSEEAGVQRIPPRDGTPRPGADEPSPMADLPVGAAFGTVVHEVLETTDPQAPDLVAALRSAAGPAVSHAAPGLVDPGTLAAALAPALRTPLGPLAGDRRLCDIGPGDRLLELPFEFPLAGGDGDGRTGGGRGGSRGGTGDAGLGRASTADGRAGSGRSSSGDGEPGADGAGAELRLRHIAALLRRHLGPGDPMHPYAARLDVPGLGDQVLRGYLSGSVDAVLRVAMPGGPRFLVVDYKTNRLGVADEPLTLADYAPEALVAAMMAAHYPLQAMLYSVALHRFLRWRQPGYTPETHLGGVLYLFLRGMAGPATPVRDGVPYGVFSWRPPPALVSELSDLLDARFDRPAPGGAS